METPEGDVTGTGTGTDTGIGTGVDSSDYTGVTPHTVIRRPQPNEDQEGDSDMETHADDFSFEPSTKTPGLTDGTGASGDSHLDNQMMLDLK